MKRYIDETCEVICEDNGRKVVAEILDFTEKKYLSVSIDRSVKVDLRWNGKIYIGKMATMNLVSNGPNIVEVKNSRR